jgi:HSP20 family protein
MNTQEEAREAMVQHRQHEEHLQQSMLSRKAQEISNSALNTEIQQEARELTVKRRQHEEHLQQSMSSRSAAEVGLCSYPDTSSQTEA